MKSPIDRAITGPRSLRDPRSREYAIQTMRSMKRYLDSKIFDAKGVARELQRVIEYRHWEACGHDNLDAYLRAELGFSVKQLKSRLAQDLAADQDVTPLRNEDGGRPRKEDNLDNINVSHQGGTSATYLVRRLKRDHPEIAEALARGEFKSARAAAIAAGIVRNPSLLERMRRLAVKATDEELRTVIAEWQRDRLR